jgi:hypothetical protein
VGPKLLITNAFLVVRSIMSRQLAFVCLVVTAVSACGLSSPARSDDSDSVEMSLPLFQEPTHEIASVNQDNKTATLKPRPPSIYAPSGEGLAVVLLASSGRGPFDTLVRVDVQEVLDGGEMIVAFGDGAAAAMRRGPAVLMRPFAGEIRADKRLTPATTKQLQALPDVLSTDTAKAASGLLGAMQAARAAARRTASMNNLKQIALAFHNYADAFRHFPPAVIYGPDGKPWHSWRVLLLPFLEQQALYEQYDFSQPWDSPANRKVSETVVNVYRDPAVEGDGAFTNYAAIVGDSAIFPPNFVTMESPDDFPACLSRNKMFFTQVTDGTSNTIMFATLDPTRRIPWAKPEDIVLDEAFPGVGKPAGIGAPHPGASPAENIGLVGFTDGSVRTVRGDLDRDTILPFLTRNGGEVVQGEALGGNPAGGNRPGGALIRIFKSEDGSYGFSVD